MVTVDRPAKEGDTVLIDYEGWVGDDQFEGGTAERQPLMQQISQEKKRYSSARSTKSRKKRSLRSTMSS